MKIIRITPGLGNQMFQYAFLLNYKLEGEEIRLDLFPCIYIKNHNGYELEKIFNIKEKKVSLLERIKITGPFLFFSESEITFLKIVNKIIELLFQKKDFIKDKRTIKEYGISQEFFYREEYSKIKGFKYFIGFFQSYKYFQRYDETIRKIFSFPKIKSEDTENFEVLEEIRNSESISIHIRRGDYLRFPDLNICDYDYYKKAFSFIKDKLKEKELKFFIFSNDIAWCKENLDFLENEKVFFIDWNKKEDSYKDMQLMSECKHNIIPNSTFSWWGAWLNDNKNKIVVAPKYWSKNTETSTDLCPESWIVM